MDAREGGRGELLPERLRRREARHGLPEVSEPEIRAPTTWDCPSGNSMISTSGFYPLGSCTMKHIRACTSGLRRYPDTHGCIPCRTRSERRARSS